MVNINHLLSHRMEMGFRNENGIWHTPLSEANSEFTPENRPGPKRKCHLPTIDFQGRAVSFREGFLQVMLWKSGNFRYVFLPFLSMFFLNMMEMLQGVPLPYFQITGNWANGHAHSRIAGMLFAIWIEVFPETTQQWNLKGEFVMETTMEITGYYPIFHRNYPVSAKISLEFHGTFLLITGTMNPSHCFVLFIFQYTFWERESLFIIKYFNGM